MQHSPINPYNNGTVDLRPGDYISYRFYRGGVDFTTIEGINIDSFAPPFKYFGRLENTLAFSNMEAALKDATTGYRRKLEFTRVDVHGGRTILLYFPNRRHAIGPYQIELSETFFVDHCKKF